MHFEEILAEIKKYNTRHVLLTGGEPLLQRGTLPFMDRLRNEGYLVSVETHGEVPISKATSKARIIMDIKTPGSKMNRGAFRDNLTHLKKEDEIKFVITSHADYEWAKALVNSGLPTSEILFSPALAAKNSPGIFEGIAPRELAELILRDQLPVRFQIQLHKLLWGADTKGV